MYVHTRSDLKLYKFSTNAVPLFEVELESALLEISLSADARLLLSTDAEGAVCIRAAGDLQVRSAFIFF